MRKLKVLGGVVSGFGVGLGLMYQYQKPVDETHLCHTSNCKILQ